MNIKESILKIPFAYRLFDSLVGKFGFSRTSLFARYLPYSPGMKILDLGCGPGTSAKYFRASDYLGIDIDQSYINSARKKYPGYEFICGDFLDIATSLVPKDGFDLILSMGVFHHLSDKQLSEYLSKAHSVLASHGRLISFDGCTYPGQPKPRRKVVLSDRGQYIRPADDLIQLIQNEGFECCASIEEDVLLIPHSMLAISSSLKTTSGL